MKEATKPGDIPDGPHWAIVVFGSIYIPGDERSRTNPGHGYPGGTESTTSYYVCKDEAEWQQEVERRASSIGQDPYGFFAISATRAVIRTRTIVEIRK